MNILLYLYLLKINMRERVKLKKFFFKDIKTKKKRRDISYKFIKCYCFINTCIDGLV